MPLVFPALPGLAWSVTKSPTFQTRIQRAASGRELRALDYPYPLWQFTLVFDLLRDNPAAGVVGNLAPEQAPAVPAFFVRRTGRAGLDAALQIALHRRGA